MKLTFLTPLIAAFGLCLVFFYLGNYQPQLLDKIIMNVDIFNITELSKKEHNRIDKIKRLNNIGILEKQVLMSRTVFIGATAEMIEYALGQPDKIQIDKESSQVVYYIYFLADERRPTFFQLECIAEIPCKSECNPDTNECILSDKGKQSFALSKAFKKSAIDIGLPGVIKAD